MRRLAGATIASLVLVAALPCSAESRWRPRPTTSPWQWQLSGPIDLSVPARVYDVDGLATRRRVVRALHRRGRRAICYVSVGSHEPFRRDAARFPVEAIGLPLEDFPDERWLDVRRLDLLAPVLRARLDVCRRKGFDGVEPDNVDGYANRTGFPITASDQLRFNRWIAREAHLRGLAVGLKNDAEQVPELVGAFDFAVVEQCFEFRECRAYSPFIRARKAVFVAEYRTPRRRFCPRSRRLRFSAIIKRPSLGRFRRSCAKRTGPATPAAARSPSAAPPPSHRAAAREGAGEHYACVALSCSASSRGTLRAGRALPAPRATPRTRCP